MDADSVAPRTGQEALGGVLEKDGWVTAGGNPRTVVVFVKWNKEIARFNWVLDVADKPGI